MEYTHILSIKVWSNTYNDITNYSNINTKVKELILDNSFTEAVNINGIDHTITIKWSRPFWDEKTKHLIVGDFITNLNYSHTYDEIILKHTEIILNKIEKELKKDKLMPSNEKIIFNIVKPLTKTKPFIDNYSR
jgi:hypothetical protein